MDNRFREKQAAEAVARMEHLGLPREVIDKFREDGTVGVCEPLFSSVRFLEEAELEKIRRIEEGYQVLIYIGIRDKMWNGVMDSYLFISGNEDEWEDERRSLEAMEPFAIVIGWDSPDRPEMGLIGIGKPSRDGLERTW